MQGSGQKADVREQVAPDLVEIGMEYMSLQLRVGKLSQAQHKLWPGSTWTPALEQRWSRKVDPLLDRMAELRWAAVAIRATSLAELKTKASILMDLVDDEPHNVSAQLTLSLCRDLIDVA